MKNIDKNLDYNMFNYKLYFYEYKFGKYRIQITICLIINLKKLLKCVKLINLDYNMFNYKPVKQAKNTLFLIKI